MRQYGTRHATLPPQVYNVGMKDVLFTLLWIMTGWMFMTFSWSIFLIKDHFNPENVEIETIHNSTHVTPASLSSEETRAEVFTSIRTWSDFLLWYPLFFTISFTIFTSANRSKIGKLWKRVAIIFFAHLLSSVPLILLSSYEFGFYWFYFCAVLLHTSMIFLEWRILAGTLKFVWRINVYWLPVLWLCCYIMNLVYYLPIIMENPRRLKDIIVYIPLVTMTMEFIYYYGLKYMFKDHQDNISGLALFIAYLMAPLEFLRYVSFVLLWFQRKGGAQNWDIVWNAIFSMGGEIYSHTPLLQFCRNEMEMRLWGRRFDDSSEICHYVSSIRSILEYLTPALFTTSLLLLRYFYHQARMVHDSLVLLFLDANDLEDIWSILLTYYLVEIVSETLCWVINNLTSYNRVSVIGNLNWGTLFLMIIYIGSATDLPVIIAGFLSVLTLP